MQSFTVVTNRKRAQLPDAPPLSALVARFADRPVDAKLLACLGQADDGGPLYLDIISGAVVHTLTDLETAQVIFKGLARAYPRRIPHGLMLCSAVMPALPHAEQIDVEWLAALVERRKGEARFPLIVTGVADETAAGLLDHFGRQLRSSGVHLIGIGSRRHPEYGVMIEQADDGWRFAVTRNGMMRFILADQEK